MGFFSAGVPSSELGPNSYKQVCRAATTGNLAALSGELTVDDVALVAGDRILVKDQSGGFGELNGIYVVAAGAWARSADMNESAECKPGMLVPVSEGTANASRIFQLQTPAPIILETTDLTFEGVEAFDHGLLLGLDGDDHTQYVKVIGRSAEDQQLDGDLKFTGLLPNIGDGGLATLVFQDLTYTADPSWAAGYFGNLISVEYIGGGTAGSEGVSLVGNIVTVEIATTTAQASLVEQDLTFEAVDPGLPGNSITVEYVDDGVSGAETVDVAGSAITVHMDGASSYAELIEQDLTFTADTIGSGGNAITITYVDDGTAGSETVGVVGNAITVHMNDDLVAASLVEQDLTFTADTSGAGGNSITIEYVDDGTAGAETVGVVGSAITVHMNDDLVAATLVEQDLTFTADTSGTGGNAITIEYVDDGTAGSETVDVVGSAITVHMNDDLVAASLIEQDLTFTADTAGAGGNAITIAYTTGATAGAEVVSVVGNAISVQIEDMVSTATQIKAALDGDGASAALINTVISGTGSNAQDAPIGPTSLAGGLSQSTATNIKDAIEASGPAAALVNITVSGNAGDPQTAIGATSLTGGLDQSTADDIKAAIDGDVGAAALVNVVVSGTGSNAQTAIGATNLTGGLTQSTADDIKTAIDASGPAAALVDVVVSGTGSNAQTAIAATNLAGGTTASTATQIKTALDASVPTAALISTTISGVGGNGQVVFGPTNLAGGLFPSTAAQVKTAVDAAGLQYVTVNISGNSSDAQIVAGPSPLTGGGPGLLVPNHIGAQIISATYFCSPSYNDAAGQQIISGGADNHVLISTDGTTVFDFSTPAITTSSVTGKLLTGFSSGAGTVAATDSILQAINKLDGNVAAKLPLAGGTMSGAVKLAGTKLTIASASSTHAVAATTDIVLCTSGTFDVDLPAATGSGRLIYIKNVGTGVISIDPDGSEIIDGSSTSLQLVTQYDAVTICDVASGAWSIL